MRLAAKIILGLTFFLHATSAFTLEKEIDLARASQSPLKINHFSEHITAPFENDLNFGYGPNNNKQDILNFKPVVPFRITSSYDLILRAIVPLFERTATVNQQNVIDGHYINGWGDINPTFFISPARFDWISWGVGPTVFIPTSSNSKNIGSGKWSLGPELVIMAMPKNWMMGFLTYNVWSVAGDSNRAAVGQFSFQYLISYIFEKGWYISTNPTITANWKKPADQQWLVPFGLGGGRSFNWGSQPLSLSMHAYYNAIRPSGVGPDWQLQLELEWLFAPRTL